MNETPQFALLRDRRFAPLFATQFFGALNDNARANALQRLLNGWLIADARCRRPRQDPRADP